MIASISIANFKSFRRARIIIPDGFVAITGPNGSGKSNVLEAIAFVMGWRARRLRAANVSHLVRRGAETASVTLELRHDGEKVEITREIRRKGESVYRINGKRSSAEEVQELLRKLGYSMDNYSFITQGDITRVVEMSARERAKLLEEISGVSAYDEKKEKALKELEEANQGIREIGAVLREREAELERAKKELEKFRKYQKLIELKRRLMASLLIKRREFLLKRLEELEKVEPEVTTSERIEEIRVELEKKEAELRQLEELVRASPLRRRKDVEAKIRSIEGRISALEKAIEAKRESLNILMRGKDVPPKLREDPSFLGLVHELIKPLPGFEVPYFALAHNRLDDIVVRDLEGALRIAKSLRDVPGRFRIIPLEMVGHREVRELPWTKGHMSNFLSYDPEFQDLARMIFNAYLVESLEDVPRDQVGKARYVSTHGEVMEKEYIVAGRPVKEAERIRKIREEIGELEKEIKEGRDQIKKLKEELERLPQEDRNIERLSLVREEVRRLRREYEAELRKREVAVSKLRRISEERGRLERELEEVESRLKEFRGVEPLEVDDPATELKKVEIELRTTGPVNPKAEEEYEVRKFRYKKVKENYDKFVERRDKILELIRKLDEEREKVLTETLRKLSREFDASIKDLFGGGEGSLNLTEKGLEMKIRLPGKKAVAVEALSGGEKSLSAIAFIMALQRLRPSPLYLLDEADAMLDGVNCKRFARAMKKMAREHGVQVIAISLKRETLEEADYLIGVTMSGGESKVVVVDMG